MQTAVEAKKKCLLIVPEQLTLRAETAMAEFLPSYAPLCFEVTNFSRLANTVFRAKGGISLHYADASASALVMWKVLDALKPLLAFDDKNSDITRVREMLSAMNELSASGITEGALENASRMLPEGDRLRDRLSDMALILRTYKGELATVYGNHAEDLDRLAALLREDAFFSDTLIYVDSFTSFTAQEYAVLEELFRMTSVTVSLTTAPQDERSFAYEETRDTATRLTHAAKRIGTPFRHLRGEPSPLPPALDHARRELFTKDKRKNRFSQNAYENGLSLWREDEPFSASMAIAADIAKHVREGARYRDFVIFTSNPRTYRGIIDAALSKQGIPSFLSEERDIFSFAAVKMILTAYAVLLRGYRKEDIIAFLKCGFGGFSSDDIDMYELYSDFWHVGGRLFTSERPLSMNPSGYKEDFTEQEAETLGRVNAVRAKLQTLFGILAAVPDDAPVAEHLTALYSFLHHIGCEKRLHALAERQATEDKAEADVLKRLFGVLCALMDEAHEILSDMRMDKERFADMLTLLLSSARLGQLPTSQDAVLIGSADMLRVDHAKYVYLLGVNEGEFPAAIRCGSVFEESERRILAGCGITVTFDPMIRSAREAFCFLRALVSGREHATVITYAKSALGEKLLPSSAFSALSAMFGPPSPPQRKEVYRPEAAVEMLGEWEGKPEKEAFIRLFGDNEAYRRLLSGSEIPLSDTDCTLSEQLARELFSKKMRTTQTRLEQYVKCPFSYYCKFLFRLGEKRDSTFGFNDIGTLIHAVAEHFFLMLEQDGKTIRDIEREDISSYVERIAQDYIDAVCPEELRHSPRLVHTLERLKRTSRLLLEELYEEFSVSAFTPSCFELQVGQGEGPQTISFPTEDGAEVIFHGTIDRVDTYRAKDGSLYFRIIDYKTGTKVFSLSDIEKGKNLQLLIYLVSLWKSKDPAFTRRLAEQAASAPLPAGMLYMSASPRDVALEAPLPADEIADLARASLTANGLLLEDMEIARAMDKDLSGRFVPSPLDKKGNVVWGKSFVTPDALEGIFENLGHTVGAIGTAMRSGVASAVPMEEGSRESPCSYCPYKTVCRKTS